MDRCYAPRIVSNLPQSGSLTRTEPVMTLNIALPTVGRGVVSLNPVLGSQVTRITGVPDLAVVGTSHVERQNLTHEGANHQGVDRRCHWSRGHPGLRPACPFDHSGLSWIQAEALPKPLRGGPRRLGLDVPRGRLMAKVGNGATERNRCLPGSSWRAHRRATRHWFRDGVVCSPRRCDSQL